ncbi:MAG: c-type cytochrome [Nitrospira sp.]|nr:c-type cytochrome [Nitrospira sp.]
MMTDACRSFGLLVALVIGMTTVFAVAVTRVAAKGEQAGEQFVRNTCTACHRIEGPVAARKTKKAPDLIWAGNKYQPAWLVNWLQNPDFKHYPVGYDFRPDRKKRHLAPRSGESGGGVSGYAEGSSYQGRCDEGRHGGAGGEGTQTLSGAWMPELSLHAGRHAEGVCRRNIQYLVHQIERAVERGLGLPF